MPKENEEDVFGENNELAFVVINVAFTLLVATGFLILAFTLIGYLMNR